MSADSNNVFTVGRLKLMPSTVCVYMHILCVYMYVFQYISASTMIFFSVHFSNYICVDYDSSIYSGYFHVQIVVCQMGY